MGFRTLGLYYVHGRWYNPEVGRFISPDEKGEYLYGSGNDAVNYAWEGEAGKLKYSMAELYEKYLIGRKLQDFELISVDIFDFALAHADEWNGEIGVTVSGRPYSPSMTELYIWERSRQRIFEFRKPILIETLHEIWNPWPQLLPEGGAIAAGIISESRNGEFVSPVAGSRPSPSQLSKVEAHLSRFGNNAPERAMLERLKSGNWTQYDQRFFEHETIEADLMARGMSDSAAHLRTLEIQGIPYERGYERWIFHPDVISEFKGLFNQAAWP